MQERLLRLEREAALRADDPLARAVAGFTPEQARAFGALFTYLLVQGGNQSGKSFWACAMVALYALGLHPWAKQQVERRRHGGVSDELTIWYGITNYQQFGEQPWNHLKRFLLYPGESVDRLPTRRILKVAWEQHNPETPKYFLVRRDDGGLSHVYVKPYEGGRKIYQAKTVDLLVLDEECENDIFKEAEARALANPGFHLIVAATPVLGRAWQRKLKREAIAAGGAGTIGYFRFRTKDNPRANVEFIRDMERRYADRPEELALRLEGEDSASSGLVYNDRIFTPAHVIAGGFSFDQGTWTLNRSIDAGFRHPAALWIAVNERGRKIIYRCWKGENLRVADAWAEIDRLSQRERYHLDLIDPEVAATTPETGATELSVWQAHGFKGTVAPDNRVLSGIDRVHDALAERVEIAEADGRSRIVPAMQVLASCTEFLQEREEYYLREISDNPQVDAPNIRRGVVKRNDHLMDPWRLLVAAGLKHVRLAPPAPPKGSTGRIFFDQRRKNRKPEKRL